MLSDGRRTARCTFLYPAPLTTVQNSVCATGFRQFAERHEFGEKLLITRKKGEIKMAKETKKVTRIWIYPSTELQVKQLVERHGYKSPSEFIEAAVLNYIGQLTTAENMDYVAQTLTTVMDGVQGVSEARLRRVLFKQAVELAMVENLLVNLSGYSAEDIRKLRGKVVKDVKNLKGSYDFVTAAEYQNGTERTT